MRSPSDFENVCNVRPCMRNKIFIVQLPAKRGTALEKKLIRQTSTQINCPAGYDMIEAEPAHLYTSVQKSETWGYTWPSHCRQYHCVASVSIYVAKYVRSMMQHERAASSDSTAIMRGDYKLNRTLLFYFLGVAPTPSGSGITKLGAPYATRG